MDVLILFADTLITAALAPFLVYLLVITAGAAMFRRRANEEGTSSWAGKFFIVIPSHEEAQVIGETVAALRSALAGSPFRYSIWVVADNCSDQTAEIAAAQGVAVLERKDASLHGKGHALAFFFNHLLAGSEARDEDAVVVIDADTRIGPNLLAAFARRLGSGADWLQGISGIANVQASWRTRLMTCAFALINQIWLMGQDALGHSVSLRGNGMCLTLGALRRVPWRAFGLAEDLEYSWSPRLARERVRFVPDAKVFSEIVTDDPRAARTQRQRWERGRKQVRRKFTRQVLKTASLDPGGRLLCLLELYMPTLTTLTLLIAIVAGVPWVAVPADLPGALALRTIHCGIVAVFLFYLLSPFWLRLLPLRYVLYLLYSPLYMLWKFDLFFRRSPTLWIRTARRPRPVGTSGEEQLPHEIRSR